MGIGQVSRNSSAGPLWEPIEQAQDKPASSHFDAADANTDASVADQQSETNPPTSIPKPFTQHPSKQVTASAKKTQELEELALLFSQNKIDIDSLLPKLLSLLCKHHTDWMSVQKKLILAEERWSDAQDDKQLQLQERVIDEKQTVQTFNKVQKGVAAGGFAFSACAAFSGAVATGPLAAVGAVVGVGYGLFLTIDTLCDDFVKKQVASFIAQGDKESEANWLSRIELFVNLSTFALGCGFNSAGAINIGMQVVKIATGVVKGTLDDRLRQLQGDLQELNFTCEQSDTRKEEFREQLMSMMKDIHYFYEIYKKVLDNQNQTAKTILR